MQRTLGLLVYQNPTGRVFAVCAELDAWRRRLSEPTAQHIAFAQCLGAT